jgi:UPF0042 nucleotide-binding protein
MDLREKEFISQFQNVFDHIHSMNYDLHIVFLEASDESLVKRYSETRRRHPLADGGSLPEKISQERQLMLPVRDAADQVVDTTNFNIHQLRDFFVQRFAQPETGHRMSIELISFGFKHGLPPEADILMDVRFLPNPFYLDKLRDLDGRDERIVEYVMASEESVQFIDEFSKLLGFLIPLYRREGKPYLTIALGCTGGQHRSVTVVNELSKRLKNNSNKIYVRHRDITSKREIP